jgi:hypothetical protein
MRAFACLAFICSGCALATPPPSPPPPPQLKWPFSEFQSARYSDPRWWLCLPGRADVCSEGRDTTELKPDGTKAIARAERQAGADQIDCFYVYPTVDRGLFASNHTDFSDLEPMRSVTFAQAARFGSVCNLYVPLYRQATLGAYLLGADARKPYREVAVSDVVDAFVHYMGQYNRGHKIVLLGHSQGAEMVVALLKQFFDPDPEARARLLLAMPVGWPLEVAAGKTRGGTFENLPACTVSGETGCVVGYRSYDAGHPADPGNALPSPGHESLCVNPAELARGSESFLGATVPTKRANEDWVRRIGGVHTPFVILADFYAGRCMSGQSGFRYLGVFTAPHHGDRRTGPVDLSNGWLHGSMGYHLLDMQFAQGDLIDLVAEASALALKASR